MIGLIGSGNMARALVRGWGEPVLCTDLAEQAEQVGQVMPPSTHADAELPTASAAGSWSRPR